MGIFKRETFDEWAIAFPFGSLRLQFFEPRLWRLGVKFQEVRDRCQPNENWPNGTPVEHLRTGWVLVLPFMTIRCVHGGKW